jgi:RHH-type proline utilization regulon transcriptional repressor/proline dehydrogenase/delta 1-pyrroline-5-carboxylate dehydrogenase
VFATISPWNFPLAIFIGMASAALAAGNTVIAKPAEQTPLIAALAVRLCHEAGIPTDVLQLAPGDGKVGAALTATRASPGRLHRLDRDRARDQPRARRARRADRRADRRDRRPERADRRQLGAARAGRARRDRARFQSAGQRCSALRVLYLQDDVADGMLR